jgi:hypothetical protein
MLGDRGLQVASNDGKQVADSIQVHGDQGIALSGRYVFVAGARSLEVIDVGPYQVKDVAALDTPAPTSQPAAAAAPATRTPELATPAASPGEMQAPGAEPPAAPAPSEELVPDSTPEDSVMPNFDQPMLEAPPDATTPMAHDPAPATVPD